MLKYEELINKCPQSNVQEKEFNQIISLVESHLQNREISKINILFDNESLVTLLEIYIPITTKEASTMSWNLVEKLIDSNLDSHSFLVGFVGTCI